VPPGRGAKGQKVHRRRSRPALSSRIANLQDVGHQVWARQEVWPLQIGCSGDSRCRCGFGLAAAGQAGSAPPDRPSDLWRSRAQIVPTDHGRAAGCEFCPAGEQLESASLTRSDVIASRPRLKAAGRPPRPHAQARRQAVRASARAYHTEQAPALRAWADRAIEILGKSGENRSDSRH